MPSHLGPSSAVLHLRKEEKSSCQSRDGHNQGLDGTSLLGSFWWWWLPGHWNFPFKIECAVTVCKTSLKFIMKNRGLFLGPCLWEVGGVAWACASPWKATKPMGET